MPCNTCTLRVRLPLSFHSIFILTQNFLIEYLHRNLKTSNLLLDELLHVKICGFGISRPKPTEKDINMTNSVGSDLWSAPEVLNDQPYGERADVFSFGILRPSFFCKFCSSILNFFCRCHYFGVAHSRGTQTKDCLFSSAMGIRSSRAGFQTLGSN